MEEGIDSVEEVINSLMEKLRDSLPETFHHSLRVAVLSYKLAELNSFNLEEETLAYNSGKLHDIGKLVVPVELLRKETELTLSEKVTLNKHVREGYLILDVHSPLSDIRNVMVRHHEYKRGGYPRNGKDRRATVRPGERRIEDPKILRVAEVLAISDMYDALRSPRAYKTPFDKDKIRLVLSSEFLGDRKYIDQVLTLD